jgi:3-dehydroquinate dehydratase-2
MARILVLHGAGMDMRGKTQIDVFGPMKLEEYDRQIKSYARKLEVEVELFHSNIEGEVINRLYAAHEAGFDACLINPAGFTNGYPALAAAISQVAFPTIEIHISNPASRGAVSSIAPACRGVITGFGIYGYHVGLQAALALIDEG